VKDEVRAGTGLTVSAGVADCKMAAKIASDLGKPDGLVIVPPGDTAAFLAPLPVSRLWGVGRVTEEALRALGIATIGALARFPEQVLAERFGSAGAHMRALARGDDPRPVVPDEEARSIGAEDTFERDLLGADALLPQLLDQCVRVARRLREAGLRGRVVTLKVKYGDFEQLTRRSTLSRPTDDAGELYRSIQEDLRRAIARAMHDGPAQSLANITLQAQIVERLIERDPGAAIPEVRELTAMVQRTLDATKTFIFDVRPMVLDDLGLVPTLRRVARDRSRRSGVPVGFDSLGADQRLPMDLESAVFRVADEAVAALVEGGPERVELTLDWGDELEVAARAVHPAD
jgi:signal transduction histidine kinase